jgi:hypothetical protein
VSRYKVEERTHGDRTELSVVDGVNGEERGRVRVYTDSIGAYVQPDIGDGGVKAIMDPSLAEALGEMFLRAAALGKARERV